MIFATGREPLWSQLQPAKLELSSEELEGVHSEDLNYLSSLNEMGKVGVGRLKPREVNGWPRVTQHTRQPSLDPHPHPHPHPSGYTVFSQENANPLPNRLTGLPAS